MNASSDARPKGPLRQRMVSGTSLKSSPDDDDPYSINFGTARQLTSITTPPTAKSIPAVTPSLSLAARTKESMRLARERQLEPTRKSARAKSTKKEPARWNNAPYTPSVSRPPFQTTTTFNASRSRATTPVSSNRPTTPSSPRHTRNLSNASSASPKTTPTAIKLNATPSTAVRDAIAKAKEAHKQKVQRTPPVARRIVYSDDQSFDDIDNPFNIAPGTPPMEAQLRRAIETARTTGTTTSTVFDLRKFEYFESRIASYSR
jgi:hypothetical protein